MNLNSIIQPLCLGYKLKQFQAGEEYGRKNEQPLVTRLNQVLRIDTTLTLVQKASELFVTGFTIKGKFRAICFITPIIAVILPKFNIKNAYINRCGNFVNQHIDKVVQGAHILSVASSIALLIMGQSMFGGITLAFLGLAYLEQKKIIPLSIETILNYVTYPIGEISTLLNDDLLLKSSSLFKAGLKVISIAGSYLYPNREILPKDAEKSFVKNLDTQVKFHNNKYTTVKKLLNLQKVTVSPVLDQMRAIPNFFTWNRSFFSEADFQLRMDNCIKESLPGFNKKLVDEDDQINIRYKKQLTLVFTSGLKCEIEKKIEQLSKDIYLYSREKGNDSYEDVFKPAYPLDTKDLIEKFNDIWLAVDNLKNYQDNFPDSLSLNNDETVEEVKANFEKKGLDFEVAKKISGLFQASDNGYYSDDDDMIVDVWKKYEKKLQVIRKTYPKTYLENIRARMAELEFLQMLYDKLNEKLKTNFEENEFQSIQKVLTQKSNRFGKSYDEYFKELWNESSNGWKDFVVKHQDGLKNKDEVLAKLFVLGTLQKDRENYIQKYICDNIPFVQNAALDAKFFQIFAKTFGLSPKHDVKIDFHSRTGYLNEWLTIYAVKAASPFNDPDHIISCIATAFANSTLPFELFTKWWDQWCDTQKWSREDKKRIILGKKIVLVQKELKKFKRKQDDFTQDDSYFNLYLTKMSFQRWFSGTNFYALTRKMLIDMEVLVESA
ncbi:MAG: hypothetical protein H0W88_00895 [Parachlamydiaceae bacterium]|nr:hypothetical protein [Parachlamydiaceae bacterium]